MGAAWFISELDCKPPPNYLLPAGHSCQPRAAEEHRPVLSAAGDPQVMAGACAHGTTERPTLLA